MSYPSLFKDQDGSFIPQYYDGSAWQPYERNTSVQTLLEVLQGTGGASGTIIWQGTLVPYA